MERDFNQAEIEEYLAFTRELLRKGRQIILERVKQKFETNTKADKSFVTAVDLEIERFVRQQVRERYPTHGVIGEELPNENPEADFQWITDPIDGTQNLVFGLPTYGSILGLHYKGKPLVGGIDHPQLDLEYSAGLNLGAWCNGEQIFIDDSPDEGLSDNEIVVMATRAMFERSGEGALFDAFAKHHPSLRVFYDCFGTTRAAHGQVGALVEFNVRIWDLAASEILITEAGGLFLPIRFREVPDAAPLWSAIMGRPKVVRALEKFFTAP